MQLSSMDELLSNNALYAEHFGGALPSTPTRKLAVVACMDTRLDVYSALRLEPGEAHIIRNAGGVVTDDVIRSLTISQRLLGTREIMLIHHTDCGMMKIRDDEFSASLERETGVRPLWSAEGFTDLEADLAQSRARIQGSPFITHKDEVRCFVFDVATGRVHEAA